MQCNALWPYTFKVFPKFQRMWQLFGALVESWKIRSSLSSEDVKTFCRQSYAQFTILLEGTWISKNRSTISRFALFLWKFNICTTLFAQCTWRHSETIVTRARARAAALQDFHVLAAGRSVQQTNAKSPLSLLAFHTQHNDTIHWTQLIQGVFLPP